MSRILSSKISWIQRIPRYNEEKCLHGLLRYIRFHCVYQTIFIDYALRKMFTFTSEFFLGMLIGFVLDLLVNWLICNSQLHNMRILSKIMKSRKLPITKPSANKIYSPDLWNALKQLYDKRTKSDPKFSFNKCRWKFINYSK